MKPFKAADWRGSSWPMLPQLNMASPLGFPPVFVKNRISSVWSVSWSTVSLISPLPDQSWPWAWLYVTDGLELDVLADGQTFSVLPHPCTNHLTGALVVPFRCRAWGCHRKGEKEESGKNRKLQRLFNYRRHFVAPEMCTVYTWVYTIKLWISHSLTCTILVAVLTDWFHSSPNSPPKRLNI